MAEQNYSKSQTQTVKFLEGIFRAQAPGGIDRRMSLSAELPIGKNQPEFWADIPWRIEPDQEALPLLFLVRDTNISSPAKGPWRLDVLKVEQRTADGSWDPLLTFLPADLPKVDSKGNFQLRTWTYSTKIPLMDIQAAKPGNTVHVRVVFHGSFFPFDKPSQIEIHLETYIAEHALPQSRAANTNQPRHWFYGDTHYHSIYTNDIKEIGNPVPETCNAAHAIGLDWLVITDHSCDLDDIDPDVSPLRRWDRLKAELTSSAISNKEFRCILGEEINLMSGGENYVHMLAFGGMQDMVEGAFLPEEGGFMTEIFQESIQKLLEKVARTGGYSDKETLRLFGKVHPFEDVLAMLPQQALTFAAHPFQVAQPPPPGIWATENLYHPRLTGFEFWNGRTRRSTQLTINPFGCSSWQKPEEQIKRDQERIKKLLDWSENKWDLALRRGLAGWADTDELPGLRPVFLAGTDAHGSFNYSVGLSWDYRSRLIVDDSALGRVRTVIYSLSPFTGEIPTEDEILAAIRKGSCVVTDGPILEFSIANDGNIAHMGEVLNVASGKDLRINIQAFTTPEFGAVEQVELYTCFRTARRPHKTTIKQGCVEHISIDGPKGYCRLFAQSASASGELFCCFTNPVWIRCSDPQTHQLIASYI